MRKRPTLGFLILLLSLTALSLAPACSTKDPVAPGPKGRLFIVGGGDRDEALMRRYVELAGGYGTGRVVIFTMASGVPLEVGPELVAEFRNYGVQDVVYYQLTRDEAMKADSAKILDGVSAIWFAGGDQVRLTAALLDTPIHARMLELYAEGCLIGGTSAGAAVMSEVMITGDEKRTKNEDELWQTVEADNVVRVRGFGFVKNAVIDQHFLIRRRQNRLLSLVLENPTLLGAGIDESTAILVRPDGKWEILGESQVYVVDARKAVVSKASSNKLGAHGLALHLLLPGDVFDPVKGRAEGPSK
ncbi:MAG TPA: cyanophycinase [Candidatus Latescibacteria bacterium]|nr:cyanophycinase [Candidatus Latescibacterota bacterium]